jgi:hypothetical protein
LDRGNIFDLADWTDEEDGGHGADSEDSSSFELREQI